MTEIVSISRDHTLILVHSSGEPSIRELEQTLNRIMELHQEHGINHVLVDSREREVDVSNMEAFTGGELIARLSNNIRFAIVVTAPSPSHRSFETIAVNRGVRISYFTDVEEAKHWLAEMQ